MGNRIYGFKVGADVAILSCVIVEGEPKVMAYRAYSKDTNSEGDITSHDLLHEYLRFAKPFNGNVGPGLQKALEGCVRAAMIDAFFGGGQALAGVK